MEALFGEGLPCGVQQALACSALRSSLERRLGRPAKGPPLLVDSDASYDYICGYTTVSKYKDEERGRDEAPSVRLQARPTGGRADVPHVLDRRSAAGRAPLRDVAGARRHAAASGRPPSLAWCVLAAGAVRARGTEGPGVLLRAGEYWGEVELLSGQSARVGVVAISDSVVFYFDRRNYYAVLHEVPAVAISILEAEAAWVPPVTHWRGAVIAPWLPPMGARGVAAGTV